MKFIVKRKTLNIKSYKTGFYCFYDCLKIAGKDGKSEKYANFIHSIKK